MLHTCRIHVGSYCIMHLLCILLVILCLGPLVQKDWMQPYVHSGCSKGHFIGPTLGRVQQCPVSAIEDSNRNTLYVFVSDWMEQYVHAHWSYFSTGTYVSYWGWYKGRHLTFWWFPLGFLILKMPASLCWINSYTPVILKDGPGCREYMPDSLSNVLLNFPLKCVSRHLSGCGSSVKCLSCILKERCW